MCTASTKEPRSCLNCKWSDVRVRTNSGGSWHTHYLCYHTAMTMAYGHGTSGCPISISDDHSDICENYRHRDEIYTPKRKCVVCGAPMTNGYVIFDHTREGAARSMQDTRTEIESFCSSKCLATRYTNEEYTELSLRDRAYFKHFDD